MLKSCMITISVSLLFLASLPLSATMVQAQNTHDDVSSGASTESISEASRRIWNGLWNGANLSVSETAQQSARRQPASSTSTVTPAAILPGQPGPSNGRYVAMGDSVAAGLGLPLTGGTIATSRDRQCGRSTQAYPYAVAEARQLQLIHVACSGATAGDLITRQGVSGPNISRQISNVFAGGQPELITVTAGANDSQWSRFIYKCYRLTCGTGTDTTVANGALALLQTKLIAFFTELELRSESQPPTVVMTGYYNPLSERCNTTTTNGGTASSNRAQRLTAAELAWIQANADALNQTIKQVVSLYPFARFAPVDFKGHDICSADPWVQGLTDKAPIHPTAQGQRVLADSVLNTLGN